MKKLILINGTMGVGKSTVSGELMKLIPPSVYLDGDWCWNMNPFVVNEENKQMVMRNIGFLLRSYLQNTGYEYVIFCWVMHQEQIVKQVLEQVKDLLFQPFLFTLTCSPEALKNRLTNRMQAEGKTDIPQKAAESINRLKLYDKMESIKIDVTDITPLQAAERIKAQIFRERETAL